MQIKNILLTGASGTVGYEVLKQLIEKKYYKVKVFDIKTPQTEKKFARLPQNFEIIYGDISNTQDVVKATQNVDAVIHLAAIIPPLADDNPKLAERVNVKGTENLIKALEQNSPQAFFMYSSSISVYGDRVKTPYITVNDPLTPSEGDEYAITKIQSEKIVQNSKLSWTIFRLAAIMGNHKISKLMFHMPLNTAMEIATPSDTARAFVNGLEHQAELNTKIFNLGGGSQCRTTYEDFLQKSFNIFGLGNLNFPDKAFAEKNFHCGYYVDGDDLENIVKFRRDDLDDYFKMVANKVNPFIKFLTKVFKSIIKKQLLRKSEPYEAFKEANQKLIKRFFNS
ncbi:NAD-dependent epimerase/dehydratase family protein [Capnocytophaga felis]|uniref:3-beta hydroxysteroid dehydrogenase/isomerase domain-containing protein n=1 Tax=Capnocytophaga felis TaxID=2267611 RepID=A0A5M4B6B5_9FLAO|nr:NAD(P)-dependent oxidoreductase [Capnocytophaga felis]GET45058.1 hypothetical protein RCZ01_03600 [Capnocytophaga felis]GET47778.1 hypothetical protein RCZ02_06090 [Capnocytophaga felis]